jgi:hypothetical protein
VSVCLIGLAAVLGSTGQPERAARLLGAGEALMETIGTAIQAADRPTYDLAIAGPRDSLGEAPFEALRAEGRAMTMEQAVELALRKTD